MTTYEIETVDTSKYRSVSVVEADTGEIVYQIKIAKDGDINKLRDLLDKECGMSKRDILDQLQELM